MERRQKKVETIQNYAKTNKTVKTVETRLNSVETRHDSAKTSQNSAQAKQIVLRQNKNCSETVQGQDKN